MSTGKRERFNVNNTAAHQADTAVVSCLCCAFFIVYTRCWFRVSQLWCVLFALNRSFYPSTSSTPSPQSVSVFVPILRPREIPGTSSVATARLINTTEQGVDSATPCHRTGYDKHNIHTHASSTRIRWKLKERRTNAKERKTHRAKKAKKEEASKILLIPNSIEQPRTEQKILLARGQEDGDTQGEGGTPRKLNQPPTTTHQKGGELTTYSTQCSCFFVFPFSLNHCIGVAAGVCCGMALYYCLLSTW